MADCAGRVRHGGEGLGEPAQGQTGATPLLPLCPPLALPPSEILCGCVCCAGCARQLWVVTNLAPQVWKPLSKCSRRPSRPAGAQRARGPLPSPGPVLSHALPGSCPALGSKITVPTVGRRGCEGTPGRDWESPREQLWLALWGPQWGSVRRGRLSSTPGLQL